MNNHHLRNFMFIIGAALAVTAMSVLLIPPITAQQATEASVADNDELARMYAEDQSDRMPPDGAAIDWKVVAPRDHAREARTKELYRDGQFHTGADYYHAAMILQHCATPEDYLLAHELSVVAISLGNQEAKWLAAASEDRFLMSIDRPQRFGTQYRREKPGDPITLYRCDDYITDSLRAAMDVPSLDEAKAQEAAYNKE